MDICTIDRREHRLSKEFERISCRCHDAVLTLCRQVPCSKIDRFCIRLNAPLEETGDAREMCRLAMRNGAKIREYCFAYSNREQWQTALKALSLRFGSDCFEPVDSAESLYE